MIMVIFFFKRSATSFSDLKKKWLLVISVTSFPCPRRRKCFLSLSFFFLSFLVQTKFSSVCRARTVTLRIQYASCSLLIESCIRYARTGRPTRPPSYVYSCPSPNFHKRMHLILRDTFEMHGVCTLCHDASRGLWDRTIRLVRIAASLFYKKNNRPCSESLRWRRVSAMTAFGIDAML